MADTYHLSLTIGDTYTSMPFPAQQDAVDAAVDAFMLAYPDTDINAGLPEPVEEDGLRAFVRRQGLEEEFMFQITKAE